MLLWLWSLIPAILQHPVNCEGGIGARDMLLTNVLVIL